MLAESDVHVVRFRLDDAFARAVELLDDAERERARRFIFERDRRRYISAHARMRTVLGCYLDRRPESLRLIAGIQGKPALVDPAIDLRFNLSHAGDNALLALTLGRDVGVDLEEERPVEVASLAARFFAPGEAHALSCLAPSERIPAFFRCWTRKEAFVKALGLGLSFPLDAFEVSVSDTRSSQLLLSCDTAPDMTDRWRIVALEGEPGCAAAVAASAGEWRVVVSDASTSIPR